MPPKPEVKECPRCTNRRPIRRSSGLCYSCHYHEIILPNIYIGEPKVCKPEPCPETDERSKNRGKVRRAVQELYSSWVNDDRPKDLERQELAAWALIDAVEDLLGKE